ncbi:class I SAM-dependent methyltransferase [Legionella tunisiensis]|uniref:class I SAM-dependent methyltransferase n=1 Tax=Legionella tunisiensis TaxID=1034944 RepID=UPI0002EE579F|nr:class I SAM-dependent methyltransferase [Legionella tunisiensis]
MSNYLLQNSSAKTEFERLQLIENIYNQTSFSLLTQAGINVGWKCLEIGAGAGGVAKWMAQKVTKKGAVVAVDINPIYLQNDDNITTIQADVCQDNTLPNEEYDCVFSRFVLEHLANSQVAINNMVKRVKNNGYILLETLDLSKFSPDPNSCSQDEYVAVCNLFKAHEQLRVNRGDNLIIGRSLASSLQQYGLKIISVNVDYPLVNGGSPVANLMAKSFSQIQSLLLDTQLTTKHDIEIYQRLALDQKFWCFYQAVVSVLAQKIMI